MRTPGTVERTLAASGGMGASLLSSFAMGFAGSMVAQSVFSALSGSGDRGAADASAGDEESTETAQADDEDGGDADDGGFDDGDFDV